MAKCVDLSEYVIEKGVKKLTKLIVPSNVTKIDYNQYENCTSLVSVVIHENVKKIDRTAF